MRVAEPFLSVIIPTKDRSSALATTLAALARQEKIEGGFEVVVADNGSADDTGRVLRAASDGEPQLRAVDQPEGGPAAARNAAVAAARGEVLLLLGDDTAPAGEGLVAAHAGLHRANRGSAYACLGRIEWSPSGEVSEFMRWLDSGGPQFHFWELAPGRVPTADYFYSSHVSLKRSAFDDAGGFDARFPFAAVEDTDLGSRLAARGVELDYHPELIVWHDHATTLEQSLARTVRVGRSAALYNSFREGPPHPRVQRPSGAARLLASTASPLVDALAGAPLPAPLRRRVWSLSHRLAYARGYELGPAEAA